MIEALLWIIRLSAAIATALTLAPLVRTGQWWIRVLDFPKLQIAIFAAAALVLGGGLVFVSDPGGVDAVALVLLGAVLVWNSLRILSFTPCVRHEVPSARSDDHTLCVMVANVREGNDRYAVTADAVRRADPDVLLLIETNDVWLDSLADLAHAYEQRVDVPRSDGLGMSLWSRYELRNTSIRKLVSERRVSIFTEIHGPALPPLRFVGLHPAPPGLEHPAEEGRRDSRERDAELVIVAREAAQDPDATWIVAGDFNDVAWSHTTRLFKRLSGLLDPRVGRGLLSTYHAEHPLLRYPVDHLFVSPGVRVQSLSRAKLEGSDHFAVVGRLAVRPGEPLRPCPQAGDHDEQQAIVRKGRRDAARSRQRSK